MSRYEYHPNPRTNGDTGIYTIVEGIDAELLFMCGAVVVIGIASVGAYLYGRARGRDITVKQMFAKYGLIDGSKE